jgi:hypothetical protein
MRKVFLFFICTSLWLNAFNQAALTNKDYLIQTSGTYLVLGNIDWINKGTTNLKNGSYVYFKGNADQKIGGTSANSFYNVNINNTGAHGVYVGCANLSVLGTLTIQTGYFDLKNYDVDFSTTGTLTGETETSRVRSTDGYWNEGGGTGRLKATRTIPSGTNISVFGLNFTPSTSLGSTIIYRGHQSQSGTSFTSSIFRYFDIYPTDTANLNLNPFNYFDAELNGISPESSLTLMQLYHSPNYWQIRPTTLNTNTNQATGSTTTSSLSNVKITMAIANCLLTATAASNSPVCETGTINLTSATTNGYGTITYNWSGDRKSVV